MHAHMQETTVAEWHNLCGTHSVADMLHIHASVSE